MHDTDYAYAIGRIRANELSLLSQSDINQLISAGDYDSAVRFLADKGRVFNENISVSEICENEMSSCWQLITESAPDSDLLKALIIGNDFQNLKAALKSVFSGIDYSDYIVSPSYCDCSGFSEMVKTKDFSQLPDYLKDVAVKAYDILSVDLSGQKAEAVIDKACLETRLEMAQKSECTLLIDIVCVSVILADVKTALRCAKAGKSIEFTADYLVDCSGIDTEKLLEYAFSGDKISDLLSESVLSSVSDYADGDFSTFEKTCDNLVTEMIKESKYDIYGAGPLVAFYFAKQAEINNVRIILSGKADSLPEDTIRMRVRDMYV